MSVVENKQIIRSLLKKLINTIKVIHEVWPKSKCTKFVGHIITMFDYKII